MKNRVREFVRQYVADSGVAPNHGWRHRFKTVGLGAGIDSRVLDAICGHAPSSIGARYGTVSMKAMTEAIGRFTKQGS